MRRRRVLVFVAGAAALLGTGCAQAAPATTTPMPGTTPVSTPAAAVRAAGWWGRAIAVPGLAALNQGRNAGVSSMSCPSPGSCAAGGVYPAADGGPPGFVAVEAAGVGAGGVEVPGVAALSKGGNPDVPVGVSSVSCASAGSCAAGGDYYTDASGKHAFVVSEVNGSWGTARQVAANLGRGAAVNTVSCAPAGNCSAGGAYDYGGYNAPFVVSEKNGVWGQAIDVPGLVTRDAWISSVSCASAGNCGAGGGYAGAGRRRFVVSDNNRASAQGIT